MGKNHSPDLICSKYIFFFGSSPHCLCSFVMDKVILLCVSVHPIVICSCASCQVPSCLQRSIMEENVTLSCLLSEMAGLVLAIYNIVIYLRNT